MFPHLSNIDMDLILANTSMSKAEVKEYYNKFCTATHGNSTISRPVFSDIMHKCFPRTFKDDLELNIFSLYDVDSSGYIEFSEFLFVIALMSDGTAQEKLKQIFKYKNSLHPKIFTNQGPRIFDADKNGTISRLELTTIVQHMFHLVPDKIKQDLPTPEKVGTFIEYQLLSTYIKYF